MARHDGATAAQRVGRQDGNGVGEENCLDGMAKSLVREATSIDGDPFWFDRKAFCLVVSPERFARAPFWFDVEAKSLVISAPASHSRAFLPCRLT
ncbi:hypothetical protein [Pseudoxanthomonas japonensis]|uniref:hypothetical protein n=1 Tax=Pseudoxanthomonas japonensis TaxID=69284 RepID=UPI001BD0B864|nr:hypothetical protein [Pseudoxanthomonas japonensis]MCR6626317.1 hypothetical protein [Pseudoxanthomonas sp.]